MALKKSLKRLVIGLFLLAGALGLVAWIMLTWVMIRPPYYQPTKVQVVELRSWPDHDSIYQSAEFPYVLNLRHPEGALTYVGALHTSDAQHPQLQEIQSLWDEFKPTVAFCEGRERMNRFSSIPEKGTLSESRMVRILAYQNDVPLYSLEPAYADEVAGLLDKFDPKMVAVYTTLRTYTTEAKNVSNDSKESLALGLLKKRTNVEGLAGTFTSLKEFDDYWKVHFEDAPDWRTLPNTESVPLLRQVGDVSREVRGQHMVASLSELVGKGERVFAVVGASHVIRQELQLRRLIEGENSVMQTPQAQGH